MGDLPSFPYNDDSFDVPEEIKSENTEIAEISKKGYQLLKENRFDEAVECFVQILEKDKENNYALVGMGDAARKQGRFKEAADYYRRCLVFHPGNSYALFGLADCYKALNQFQKAIEIWEQYLLHDNSNITVLTRVADAYRKVHDFRKSKAIYLRVLELNPDNHYALIGLGHLHYDFKEYKEAMSYWQRMVELEGENVDIRVLTAIGNCFRKLKYFDKGIPYFEKALAKEPDNFYALFGIADCYRGIGKQHMSLQYWNKILEKDPRNKVILTRAGDAYRNMGDFEKAAEYYQNALNIEFDIYAVLGLAVIARQQGKYEDAIASLRTLIQNDPKNYRIYIELAQTYLMNNQKQQAIEVLNEFQKTGIRNPMIQEALQKLTGKA
ncbi:MAG: tetratricopeptide repeat protein [Rectinemataceae bacterium]|nr:tetratricopeptide repeat protein [Spirochaetaceae bacterium]